MNPTEELEQKAKDCRTVKDYEGLFKIAEKLIKAYPKIPSGYYYRGICKTIKSDFDGAIDDFTISINIDQNFENSFYRRGMLFERLKKTDNAFEDYSEAIRVNPHDSDAYYRRAHIYSSIDFDDRTSAIEDLKCAILYATNDKFIAQCYYAMGNNYGWLENFEESILYFEKVIEISPDNSEAYRNIAENKAELGDYKSALIAIKKAIELGLKGWDYLIERYEKEIQMFDVVTKNGDFNIIELSNNEMELHLKHFRARNQLMEEKGRFENKLESKCNVILNRRYIAVYEEHHVEGVGVLNEQGDLLKQHEASVNYYYFITGKKKLDVENVKSQLLKRIQNDGFFWHDSIYINIGNKENTGYLLTITKNFVSNEKIVPFTFIANYREEVTFFIKDSIENNPFCEAKEKKVSNYFYIDEQNYEEEDYDERDSEEEDYDERDSEEEDYDERDSEEEDY